MINGMRHPSSARQRYVTQLESSLQRLMRVQRLPRPPWATLTLNAAFYLDSYLTPAQYRATLDRAIHAAAAEADGWLRDSATASCVRESRSQAIDPGAHRGERYRAAFEGAAATGSLTQIVLAQHACEIAEVVEQALLPLAFRVSQAWQPLRSVGDRQRPGATVHTLDQLIEQLCAALLVGRIGTGRFVLALLGTHAARRARELVDSTFDAPFRAVTQRITPMLGSFAPPRTLPSAAPHALARRAARCGLPWALLLVEAGLVEADRLDDSRRALLLAALDRVLPSSLGGLYR